MADFHASNYPELKRTMMKIGQKLSTPDFHVIIITRTKSATFGSSYPFEIKVITPDHVSEEELDSIIEKKDWRGIIIAEICESYPDSKLTENGIYIPSIKGYVVVPEITWL